MKFHSILLWLVIVILSSGTTIPDEITHKVCGPNYNIHKIVPLFYQVGQAIHNGSRVVEDTFNYQVSLWENREYICSGAIIDTWHILTAAHCVSDGIEDDYLVLAGSKPLKPLKGDCGSLHSVSKINISEDFEMLQQIIETDGRIVVRHYGKGDIALLTLSTPLTFGINIDAVKLPSRDVSFTAGELACKVAGWGCTECGGLQLSHHLLWTDANLFEYEKCAKLVPVTEDMICTLHPDQATTLLQGDSGAGLVCDDILVGIAANSRLDPHLPIRHMNVYYFLSFINRVRNEDCNLYGVTKYVPAAERKYVPCVCL